jgi:hypothetical protein
MALLLLPCLVPEQNVRFAAALADKMKMPSCISHASM